MAVTHVHAGPTPDACPPDGHAADRWTFTPVHYPRFVHRWLALLTTTLMGLSAGAMVLIRLVLVPFWRELPPRQFREWFASHSGRIRALMAPLGAAAAAAGVGTAAAEAARRDGAHATTMVAAASGAGVVGITLTVNEPANEHFVRPDFDDLETERLLARWVRWHNVRVGLGILGAAAAALTLAAGE